MILPVGEGLDSELSDDMNEFRVGVRFEDFWELKVSLWISIPTL